MSPSPTPLAANLSRNNKEQEIIRMLGSGGADLALEKSLQKGDVGLGEQQAEGGTGASRQGFVSQVQLLPRTVTLWQKWKEKSVRGGGEGGSWEQRSLGQKPEPEKALWCVFGSKKGLDHLLPYPRASPAHYLHTHRPPRRSPRA